MEVAPFFCAMDNRPIGVFDSGIGGLTLATAILSEMPNERIVYFGDTAHLPYGDKSPESIKTYTERIGAFLIEQNCKAILIACNTASAIGFQALEELAGSKTLSFNVVDPVVAHLAGRNDRKIGVIGTKGTIGSHVYRDRIKAQLPKVEVVEKATSLLASMIEEGFHDNTISQAVIQAYLEDSQFHDLDCLVPACTHYPIIKDEIEAFFENQVEVLDAPGIVARHIKKVLVSKSLLADSRIGDHQFFVSDLTIGFERATRIFFGQELNLKEHRFPDQ